MILFRKLEIPNFIIVKIRMYAGRRHYTKNEGKQEIYRKLQNWSHLLEKSIMENFIFCAVPELVIISFHSLTHWPGFVLPCLFFHSVLVVVCVVAWLTITRRHSLQFDVQLVCPYKNKESINAWKLRFIE